MSEQKFVEKKIGQKVNAAPRVSVVIPAYNVAGFIGETLDSVLAQTFAAYEIVLVNDGSPDTEKLEKALENYFEKIVYVRQQNGGTASARNTGIENARGELLAFLDGDDIWLPEYLSEQIEFLTANNLEMVYADAHLFGAVGSAHQTYMQKSPSAGAADFEGIVSGRCSVITSGTLVYKRKILDAGMFDTELPRIGMEDFDLWLRLAKAGVKIGYQRKILLKYRVSPNSLSGNSIQRARRNVVGLNIVKEKLELTPRETEVLNKTLAEAEAELLLEIGKAHLLREEFAEARKNFRAANAHYKKTKLKLIDLALAISPRTLVRLFKKQRAAELPFIPTSDF
ncbi:MAG: glycosyltransferase family 2 protein [Acidobacteriota bacterium]|nr:glycosyltransferase family 2 protein [Acidobacteriota bacterium]